MSMQWQTLITLQKDMKVVSLALSLTLSPGSNHSQQCAAQPAPHHFFAADSVQSGEVKESSPPHPLYTLTPNNCYAKDVEQL